MRIRLRRPAVRHNPIDKGRLAGTILYGSKIRDGRRMERIPVEAWLRRWSGNRTFETFFTRNELKLPPPPEGKPAEGGQGEGADSQSEEVSHSPLAIDTPTWSCGTSRLVVSCAASS